MGETKVVVFFVSMYTNIGCVLPPSEDAEFLWRLARASRDLSLLPDTDAGRKKQLTFEAFEYAKRALERDEKCFAAHKVSWVFHPTGTDVTMNPDISAYFSQLLNRTYSFLPFLLTKWYAVCLSDIGEYEGVKVKIGNSYIIREHLEVRETSESGSCNKLDVLNHFPLLPPEGHSAQPQRRHILTHSRLLVSGAVLLLHH